MDEKKLLEKYPELDPEVSGFDAYGRTVEVTAKEIGLEKKPMTTVQIRRIIYDRQHGECHDCSKFVTWNQAHLHEVTPRGKGGEISLDNSVILCYSCHINGRHGSRRPQFKGTGE